uniref:Trichohyalin-plectin-homology domain-containing protein n=1 Tax=Phaeomonas parva TaxID=124430 RepID=A0A7S1Y0J5_9STRA|mmetsp:Transcript_7373/g.21481  ORF Transcript_7373/g.21481 Transcript_7373/m.21481 type:complete len:471 (+) Transcript_7373:127-1539(+)
MNRSRGAAKGVVISRSELQRMRDSVSDVPQSTVDARRRERLTKLSEDRVKNWPNTLQAMRRKKENWKREKLAAEEAKRQELDREEAKHQATIRANAISRAQKLMYDETDRMKQLRSQKLFTEVVADRNHQVQVRAALRAKSKEEDLVHFQIMKKQLAEADAREAMELERRRENAREVARIQQGQLEECRQRYMAHLIESQKEGEAILAKAKEEIRQELEERRASIAKEKKAIYDMAEANRYLQGMKVGDDVIEAAEEEKRKQERYVIEKRERDRQAYLKKRFDEKQALRQRMIDRATSELTNFQKSEDERVERELKEARDRELAEEMRRKELQREQKRMIDESRNEQMKRHREEAEQRERDAQELAAQWRKEVEDALAQEAAEKRERREEAIRVQKFLRQQIRDKMAKRATDRERAMTEHRTNQEKLASADDAFLVVLEQEIEEARRQGKSTMLLERLRKVGPEELIAAV